MPAMMSDRRRGSGLGVTTLRGRHEEQEAEYGIGNNA